MTAAALYLIRNHCRFLYLRCLQFRQDQNDLTAREITLAIITTIPPLSLSEASFSVALKGASSNSYTLTVWKNERCAASLSLFASLPKPEWRSLITGMAKRYVFVLLLEQTA